MRLPRMLALGASMLALLSACSTGGGGSSAPASVAPPAAPVPSAAASTSAAPPPQIRIGSDGFYEAKLMAEIYAQALEAKGFTVDRTGIGIGARKVSAPALESGQFDLKPEYIGSGLAFYEPPGASPAPSAGSAPEIDRGDAAAVAAELQSVLSGKGGGIPLPNYSPAAD